MLTKDEIIAFFKKLDKASSKNKRLAQNLGNKVVYADTRGIEDEKNLLADSLTKAIALLDKNGVQYTDEDLV